VEISEASPKAYYVKWGPLPFAKTDNFLAHDPSGAADNIGIIDVVCIVDFSTLATLRTADCPFWLAAISFAGDTRRKILR
jgi:hypothetical protein